MRKLALVALALIVVIGCKKKKNDPEEPDPTPVEIKNYRIGISQGPHNTGLPGSDTVRLNLMVNDTVALAYRCVMTGTSSAWKDLNSGNLMPFTTLTIPYFKTGDRLEWKYNYKTTSSATFVKYFITEVYLIEKVTQSKTTLFKMTKPDTLYFNNKETSKQYSFKIQ